MPWLPDAHARKLFDFTSRLIRFRLEHPIFHQPSFFKGRPLHGSGMKDLTWFNPDGSEMDDEGWSADFAKVLGLVLSGDSLHITTYTGEPIQDKTFLLYFNAHSENVLVKLPSTRRVRWRQIIDTTNEHGFVEDGLRPRGGEKYALTAHSLTLFQQETGTGEEARHASRRKAGQGASAAATART
jgi:glycogen operon protein